VCMDQFLIDLGPGSTVGIGEDVWLIGGPGPDPVTAEDWAAWLGTITYEVTCGIGVRVPRVHLDG
ncbi:MAG TPA: alanine racemase C-terminal domain-containing protein, partial [Euzebya sp.]|nr:alanine racemase C-terminal domain-containing protein [Euzebya sp.]